MNSYGIVETGPDFTGFPFEKGCAVMCFRLLAGQEENSDVSPWEGEGYGNWSGSWDEAQAERGASAAQENKMSVEERKKKTKTKTMKKKKRTLGRERRPAFHGVRINYTEARWCRYPLVSILTRLSFARETDYTLSDSPALIIITSQWSRNFRMKFSPPIIHNICKQRLRKKGKKKKLK